MDSVIVTSPIYNKRTKRTPGIIHILRLYTICYLLYTIYMKYIDIHSHLGFEDYGVDRAHVIKRMINHKVGTIAVGADYQSSVEAVRVTEEFEHIWACIGMHPTQISEERFDENKYEELIKHPRVVAVGECGLEYFKLTGDIEKIKINQREDFIKQINLALKYNKPLMLHIRDGEKRGEAYEDAYSILKDYKGKIKGDVHFFAGSLDWAKRFIDLGFTISFTGLITYIKDFDKIIKTVPLESLQAETDAPYVTPVPYRGQRNEPAYVIEVYKKIAEIRGEDPEGVRLQLLANAKRVFGI